MAFMVMSNKSTIPTTSGIMAETCGRCGRPLKNDKSRKDGFGPKCFKKWQADGKPIQTEIEDYIYSAFGVPEELIKGVIEPTAEQTQKKFDLFKKHFGAGE